METIGTVEKQECVSAWARYVDPLCARVGCSSESHRTNRAHTTLNCLKPEIGITSETLTYQTPNRPNRNYKAHLGSQKQHHKDRTTPSIPKQHINQIPNNTGTPKALKSKVLQISQRPDVPPVTAILKTLRCYETLGRFPV